MKARFRVVRTLLADDRGAIAIITLVFAVFLVAALYYLIGIGNAILHRERMQDAADAAAFASAVIEARGMNLIALLNTVMALMLAVLVALRLMEAFLAVACVGVAAANVAAFGTLSGIMSLLAAQTLTIEKAHKSAKETLIPLIATLHEVDDGLRTFVPFVAIASASTTIDEHYAPPAEIGFVVPSRITLPVESAPYSVLCAKSGEYVADIALAPFRAILIKPVDFIVDGMESALTASIQASPTWFCDADGVDLAVPSKETRPALPSLEQCVADVNDKKSATSDCAKVQKDIDESKPDSKTGDCTGACVKERYLERAEQARKRCNPMANSGLHDFVWQERRVERQTSSKHQQDEVVISAKLKKGKVPPCFKYKLGYEWNTKMHEAAHPDRTLAVCTLSAPNDKAGSVVDEVSQVFSCEKDVTVHEPVEGSGDETPTGAANSKSPFRLLPKLELGDEAFQMRAFVLGKCGNEVSENVLRVASRGHDESKGEKADGLASLPFDALLSRIQVAQAEYFFAGKDLDTSMWDMDWKARLRRFRLKMTKSTSASAVQEQAANPSSTEILAPSASTFEGACGAASAAVPDSGQLCDAVSANLDLLGDWIVH